MEIIKWFKQVETTFTHCYGCTPGFFQSVTIGPRQTWGASSGSSGGADKIHSAAQKCVDGPPWHFFLDISIYFSTLQPEDPQVVRTTWTTSNWWLPYRIPVFFRFLALSRPQASWGTHKLLAPILRPPATSTSCASGCWWMLMLYIGWITFRLYKEN